MTTVRKGSAERTNIPHTRLEKEGLIWEEYYEQGRKLGQGAFGKVHLATNKSTGVQWAIKTVNKDKAGSSAIKLLEREVAILKRVSHKNIIQLNEVFETAKRMYLVMEFCEGGELADILKEKKYFMESEVKIITKELASAIAYLHKNDIVHRDLKLENILVKKLPDATNPEDKLQIKVTDFGLSITKSGVGHDNMMQDFCGTPSYMAPEIIDNKTYSQQCDVWALGVMVYTLFCGYMPFRSKDEDNLYELIKKGELDFSDEMWKEVSEPAKVCLQKMINVDPAHRLSASEVLDHNWITGSQDRQSTNVLEMMKAWKDELKVGNEDEDLSAINGETEGVNGPSNEVPEGDVETIYELDAPRDNGSRRSSDASTGRQGSGGTKKPGSGGKRTGKTTTQHTPKAAVSNSTKVPTTTLRATGAKSPNAPSSRLTPSHPRQTPQSVRPTPTPTTMMRQTQNSKAVTSNNKPSTKGTASKK